jgi:hypothetical protein
MRCCDKYENCNQGRDCPIRISRAFPASILKRLFRRFFYWLLIAILGVMWLALLVACTYTYAN